MIWQYVAIIFILFEMYVHNYKKVSFFLREQHELHAKQEF
jgi:hypothetical protein